MSPQAGPEGLLSVRGGWITSRITLFLYFLSLYCCCSVSEAFVFALRALL